MNNLGRIGAALVACALFVSIPLVADASPAQVYVPATPDEHFIEKVYQDFLARGASEEEIAGGVTYLATHTRTQLLNWLFQKNEFVYQWVWGTYSRYLEAPPTDTEFIVAVGNLQSNGSFFQTETTVLSSAAYFTKAGATNTDFVTLVFQDVLHRAPDPSGLSYYVGQLNTSGMNRTQVASTVIRSTEGSTRRVNGPSGVTTCPTVMFDDFDSLDAGSYCLVLDRLADPSGLSYWVGQLSGSAELPSLWANNAGSTEYYTHAQP